MPRLSTHFALQDPRITTVPIIAASPASITQDSNQTITPDQLLTGWILRSGPTAGRTDTLPSARDLCEGIQGVMVGSRFDCAIRNTSGQTVTIAAGKGGTVAPGNTVTVATVSERDLTIVVNSVTPGLEAYTVYSRGQQTY